MEQGGIGLEFGHVCWRARPVRKRGPLLKEAAQQHRTPATSTGSLKETGQPAAGQRQATQAGQVGTTQSPRPRRVSTLGRPWPACRASRATRIGRPAPSRADGWPQGVEPKRAPKRRTRAPVGSQGEMAQHREQQQAQGDESTAAIPATSGMALHHLSPCPSEAAWLAGLGPLKPSERRLATRASTGPSPAQPQAGGQGLKSAPPRRAGEQVDAGPGEAWCSSSQSLDRHAHSRRTHPPHRGAAAPAVQRRSSRIQGATDSGVHRLRCHRIGGDPVSAR